MGLASVIGGSSEQSSSKSILGETIDEDGKKKYLRSKCFYLNSCMRFCTCIPRPVSVDNHASGIFLVLLAQIVSATQMVLEETYLKHRGLPPLLVTGLEGVFGTIIMLVVRIYIYVCMPPLLFFENCIACSLINLVSSVLKLVLALMLPISVPYPRLSCRWCM